MALDIARTELVALEGTRRVWAPSMRGIAPVSRWRDMVLQKAKWTKGESIHAGDRFEPDRTPPGTMWVGATLSGI